MSEAAITREQSVRGLLLPISSGNLLLPNAAVVEVLREPASLKQPAKKKPDWYKGDFSWRKLSLPLVSWSELLGQPATKDDSLRNRVAVCHLLTNKKKATFVGVETSGLPHLVTVSEAELHAVAESANSDSCVLGKVAMEEGVAYIPDLEALGKMLAIL